MKVELEETKSKMEVEKSDLEEKLSQREQLYSSLEVAKKVLEDQLQAKMVSEANLANELEQVKKDLSEAASNSEAATSSLLEEQEKMAASQKQLQAQVLSVEKELASKNNLLEEVKGKMSAFQESLNTVSTENKELELKLEHANKQVARIDATEAELGTAREELNRYKLELAQSGLLSRLKSEQEASEKTHGQRTALVGMLEAQLAELNDSNAETQAKLEAAMYDLGQKDDDLKAAREDVEKLEKSVAAMKNQTDVMRKAATDQKSQSITDKDIIRKAKLADSLQKDLQSLQQQMAKKSSAAQRLLQQREADCQDLKKRIKTLQKEVDKGSLSDRRIFELAAQQSNRESVATAEIDARNQMVERLTEKLVTHDDELATAEYSKKEVEKQVEELCRIHRREDVNLDYLKGTIVQYLSKPPGSSERNALLPVIATLLQFDSEDYKLIEQGKQKVSWFGSVLPTIINAPMSESAPPSMSTANPDHQVSPLLSGSSAEVTISSPPSKTPMRRANRTSLQF